jgi:DNA-binding NarL/FixJ family response regulator
MGALIGQLIRSHRAAVPGDYIERLVRALEHDMAERASDERPTPAAGPGLVTALRDREFEVLHLLAAGKPIQDIADELHMALNTVKKHASSRLSDRWYSNRGIFTNRDRRPPRETRSTRQRL